MSKKHKTEISAAPPGPDQPAAESQSANPAAPQAGADLAAQLATSKEEAGKNWDLYLRARADLENYRKRAQREKEDLGRFGNETLLRELLPVLDNLARAVAHAKESGSGDGILLQGVDLTLNQLRKVFDQFGVTEVETVGQPFNPACHEAMGQQESAELPPGSVALELQKGYLLNQRLLRPALVMVSKAPAGNSEESQNT